MDNTDRWQYYFEERWTDFSNAENDHIVRCYEDGLDKCEFVGPEMDYVIYFVDMTSVSRSGRRRAVRIRPLSDDGPDGGATRPKSRRDRLSSTGSRRKKSQNSVHHADGDNREAPQPSAHRRHGPKKWITSSTDSAGKKEEARRFALHQHASGKVGLTLTTPRVRFDEPGEDGSEGIQGGIPGFPPGGLGANPATNAGLPPPNPRDYLDSYHEEGIDDYDSEYDDDDDDDDDDDYDDDDDDSEFTDESDDDYEYAHSGDGTAQHGQPLSPRSRNLYPDRDVGGPAARDMSFGRSHSGSGRSYSGDGIAASIYGDEFHARRGGEKIRHHTNNILSDRSARLGHRYDYVDYEGEDYYEDSPGYYYDKEGPSGERERGGVGGYFHTHHRRPRGAGGVAGRGDVRDDHLYHHHCRGDAPSRHAPDRACAEHEHRASLRSNDASRDRDGLLLHPRRRPGGIRESPRDVGGVYERRKRLDSSDSTSRPSSSVFSHPSLARRSDNSPHGASVRSERASAKGRSSNTSQHGENNNSSAAASAGGSIDNHLGVNSLSRITTLRDAPKSTSKERVKQEDVSRISRSSNASSQHGENNNSSAAAGSIDNHLGVNSLSRITMLRDAPKSTSKESVKQEDVSRISRSSNASTVTAGAGDRRLSGRPQSVPENKEYLERDHGKGEEHNEADGGKICDTVGGVGGRPHVPTPQQAPPPHPSVSQCLRQQQPEQQNQHVVDSSPPLPRGPSQKRYSHTSFESPRSDVQWLSGKSSSAASSQQQKCRGIASITSDWDNMTQQMPQNTTISIPRTNSGLSMSKVEDSVTHSTGQGQGQGQAPTSSTALSESHITYFKRKPGKSTSGLPGSRETGSTGISIGTLMMGDGDYNSILSSRLSRGTAEGEENVHNYARERGRTTEESFLPPHPICARRSSRGRQSIVGVLGAPAHGENGEYNNCAAMKEDEPDEERVGAQVTSRSSGGRVSRRGNGERSPRELLVRVSCGQTVYMVSTHEGATVAELKYQIAVQHHIRDVVLRSNSLVLEHDEELRRVDVTKLSIQPLAK